jgi:hypothetical protein
VQGRKTIETRTWNTRFRGTFYIHAARKVNERAAKLLGVKKFQTGALIGKATLVSVKKYKDKKEFQKDAKKHLALSSYKPYGYLLTDTRRIKPVPCRGQLNFFDVRP